MPDFKKQLATFVQMLRNIEDEFKPVSYTHLTLPTKVYV